MLDLKRAGEFNATGVKVTIPSGTISVPGRAVLASRVLASGVTARMRIWSAKVIDIGNADQVYFQITRNGLPIQSGLDRVPGVQFDYQPQMELSLDIGPGLIEILAFNISGMSTTIESDAITVGTPIAAQAWWIGDLLSTRGGF